MTTTQDKIREVLEDMIGIESDFKKCVCNYDGVFHPTTSCPLHGEESFEKGKRITQALTSITKIIEEKKKSIEIDEKEIKKIIRKFFWDTEWDEIPEKGIDKLAHILATHISQWAKIKGGGRWIE